MYEEFTSPVFSNELKNYSKVDVQTASKHVRFSAQVGIREVHIKIKIHSPLFKQAESETQITATLDKITEAGTLMCPLGL